MQGTVTDERHHTMDSQVSAINEALAEKVGPQSIESGLEIRPN